MTAFDQNVKTASARLAREHLVTSKTSVMTVVLATSGGAMYMDGGVRLTFKALNCEQTGCTGLNGKCRAPSISKRVCECKAGFTGQRCEFAGIGIQTAYRGTVVYRHLQHAINDARLADSLASLSRLAVLLKH